MKKSDILPPENVYINLKSNTSDYFTSIDIHFKPGNKKSYQYHLTRVRKATKEDLATYLRLLKLKGALTLSIWEGIRDFYKETEEVLVNIRTGEYFLHISSYEHWINNLLKQKTDDFWLYKVKLNWINPNSASIIKQRKLTRKRNKKFLELNKDIFYYYSESCAGIKRAFIMKAVNEELKRRGFKEIDWKKVFSDV